MDILFRRAQTSRRIGDGVNFKLHAKIELDEEETGLVKRYKFDQSMLIKVAQPDLMRFAILVGVLVCVAILCFFFFGVFYQFRIFYRVSMPPVVLLAGGCGVLAGLVLYHQLRETIYVKDLIHGRYFTCPSVVALARKEAYLQNICAYLRQVIESAKHWDGDEKHAVLPLPPEEAKRMILSGPLF